MVPARGSIQGMGRVARVSGKNGAETSGLPSETRVGASPADFDRLQNQAGDDCDQHQLDQPTCGMSGGDRRIEFDEKVIAKKKR